jgi:hypothetical protein
MLQMRQRCTAVALVVFSRRDKAKEFRPYHDLDLSLVTYRDGTVISILLRGHLPLLALLAS